jgi:hypothetical protein
MKAPRRKTVKTNDNIDHGKEVVPENRKKHESEVINLERISRL